MSNRTELVDGMFKDEWSIECVWFGDNVMPEVTLQQKKRFVRLRRQSDEFGSEASTFVPPDDSEVKAESARKALLWKGVALVNCWKSFISYIESGNEIDYKLHANELLSLAKESDTQIKDVLIRCAESSDLASLKLASHEMENIVVWLESWPAGSAERRAQSRQDIQNGDTLNSEEFIEALRTLV